MSIRVDHATEVAAYIVLMKRHLIIELGGCLWFMSNSPAITYPHVCRLVKFFNVCIHTEYILMVNRTGKVNMNEQQFRSKPYF